MKNLLYKEFTLAAHPTIYLFLLFDMMLLIPSYPYYVAFIYTALSVFLVFLTGRENRDIFYTAMLPVRKRDIVRARCLLIAIIELAQVVLAIPFAVLTVQINPIGFNKAGIEANVAFFGLVLIMYALFNLLFLPIFYKTGYSAGKAFAVAGTVMLVYVAAAEIAVQLIRPLKVNLDTTRPDMMVRQLPLLAAGIVIYAAATALACKISGDRFEKVDL